jgi:NAD(P)-dependent dehydrogenase (short-subunit alcohol dehydrogenase family)
MGIDLSHRRILVTGAAQGLGLGIARHLARWGAALVLTDVNRLLEDHLRDAVFARSIGMVQDLADPDAAGKPTAGRDWEKPWRGRSRRVPTSEFN